MYRITAHKSVGLTLTNVENSNLVYPPCCYDAVGVACVATARYASHCSTRRYGEVLSQGHQGKFKFFETLKLVD